MKRFKKDKNGLRFIVKNYKTWLLYPYTPYENEFETGAKYRLCEKWYNSDWGEYRIIERCKVSSIKEAEKLLNEKIIT